MPRNFWSKDEDAKLVEMANAYTSPQIAKLLGTRSEAAVRDRAERLGIKLKKGELWWSADADADLTRLAVDHPGPEIAKIMGRSRGSIMGRAHRLGVKLHGVGGHPKPPQGRKRTRRGNTVRTRAPTSSHKLYPILVPKPEVKAGWPKLRKEIKGEPRRLDTAYRSWLP